MDRLLGCWRLERTAGGADDSVPMELTFLPAGGLDFAVHVGGDWLVLPMTYRLEGGTLVIVPNASTPEDRARYRFERDGTLFLHFDDGRQAWLRRGERQAPAANRTAG